MSGQKASRMIIRIESDLKKRFDAICQEKMYNKSEIVRILLKNFIENYYQTKEKEGQYYE